MHIPTGNSRNEKIVVGASASTRSEQTIAPTVRVEGANIDTQNLEEQLNRFDLAMSNRKANGHDADHINPDRADNKAIAAFILAVKAVAEHTKDGTVTKEDTAKINTTLEEVRKAHDGKDGRPYVPIENAMPKELTAELQKLDTSSKDVISRREAAQAAAVAAEQQRQEQLQRQKAEAEARKRDAEAKEAERKAADAAKAAEAAKAAQFKPVIPSAKGKAQEDQHVKEFQQLAQKLGYDLKYKDDGKLTQGGETDKTIQILKEKMIAQGLLKPATRSPASSKPDYPEVEVAAMNKSGILTSELLSALKKNAENPSLKATEQDNKAIAATVAPKHHGHKAEHTHQAKPKAVEHHKDAPKAEAKPEPKAAPAQAAPAQPKAELNEANKATLKASVTAAKTAIEESKGGLNETASLLIQRLSQAKLDKGDEFAVNNASKRLNDMINEAARKDGKFDASDKKLQEAQKSLREALTKSGIDTKDMKFEVADRDLSQSTSVASGAKPRGQGRG